MNSAGEMFGLTKRQFRKIEVQRQTWAQLPELKRKVCELLWNESMTTDILQEKLACNSSELAIQLVELEMLGLIEQVGNRWSLK